VAASNKRSASPVSVDITTTKCLQLYPAVERAFVKANSIVPSLAVVVGRLFRTNCLQHGWHYAL